MKNTIMNGLNLKNRNEELDAVIRHIFTTYPNICLRQVVDQINNKYDGALLAYYRLQKIDKNYKSTKLINNIVNEVLVESAKMLHQYIGYDINELPAICVAPYLNHIQNEVNEDILKSIKNSMYGNKTVKDFIMENSNDCPSVDNLVTVLFVNAIN